MSNVKKTIPMDDLNIFRDNYDGFCRTCNDITNSGGCEPDARNYVCDSCGKKTVFGIEEAFMMGLFEVE